MIETSDQLDTAGRITKLQKDVEEIREELQDQWHDRRSDFEARVRKCLSGDKNAIILYLEVDGQRSIEEIESALMTAGRRIAHVSLWRASVRLVEGGLVRKYGVKGRSPVYDKRPWAKVLDMEGYVRKEMLGEQGTL